MNPTAAATSAKTAAFPPALPAAAGPATASPTARRATGPNPIALVLRPFASLWLTCILLTLSMVLVFAGTSAQKELSLIEVLDGYFYAWWSWIPLKYLLPLAGWAWQNDFMNKSFPFPGGYTLIVALLVNLLAAHSVRFKVSWKRSGILLIHFSLILLLVGELLTSVVKQEDNLRFREGDTRQWVADMHDYELAIIDKSPAEKDRVVVVPDERLGTGAAITGDPLPFDVKVERWYPNSVVPEFDRALREAGTKGDAQATAGKYKDLTILEQQLFTGVEAERVDTPSAFVTFSRGGQSLGTYLLSVWLDEPQEVVVDGKAYGVDLRFERTYLPYSLHLVDFTHDRHTGTGMAKDFASRVRLRDPENGVDREVVIRMNEPLRYAGRTFYQSSFNPMDEKETTLQVVDNSAWLMPYFACVIGGIGLLIHFGIVLVNFLRKRAKSGQLAGFSAYAQPAPVVVPPPLPADRAGKKKRNKKRENAGDGRSYTLPAQSNAAAWIVPAALVALALLYVGSHLAAAGSNRGDKPGAPVVRALGPVPVSFDGRLMPLDSVARSSLKIISARESIKTDEGRVPAIQWLTDVMAGTPAADEYKVFRIDYGPLKDLLGLTPEATKHLPEKQRIGPNEKLFSFRQLLLDNPKNGPNLQEQVDKAKAVPDKRRDLYQRKVLDLYSKLSLHLRLAQAGETLRLVDLWSDKERAAEVVRQAQEAMRTEPDQMTPQQVALMEQFQRLQQQVRRLQMLAQSPDAKTEDLYFVPPAQAGGEWRGLGQSLLESGGIDQGDEPTNVLAKVPPEMRDFLGILRDYRDGNAAGFNAAVPAYLQRVEQRVPTDAAKASHETFFNRFDPFMVSIVFYVGAFLFVAFSWLVWRKPLGRGALALLLVALVVHTVGLVMRIYISGRPPVTNLYSAAVFIGWGAVVLALGVEWVFRNGLGTASAALVGFGSLLLAGGLGNDGDTMKQLQAVLDTNFWLATHVVCITLGYAAVFLAGALAIGYILGGLFTPAMEDPETRKSLVRATYGILCFALLFSFIGTILGGIWADQSWGRFWGWDPKENGAVLIVLWVALILHARWGGVVKERGIMVLSVLGNIVTAWSFFGTNMMGVGLHSYGFMESGVWWLSLFVTSQLLIAGMGLMPLGLWVSFSGDREGTGAAAPLARRG